MPNQTELARMAQTARERMPSLATIKRLGKTSNSYGGESQTYSQVYTNVPCRITVKTQSEAANTNAALGDLKISFPAGTDVVETDRIEVDGKSYAVVGIVYQKSFEITRDVEVKKV